ncbi:hypothetical protein TNCV_1999411 [Trichonephila clavipes]|nr:hypothetical protein TNCV_1999411 [Trichonephila clavipes]
MVTDDEPRILKPGSIDEHNIRTGTPLPLNFPTEWTLSLDKFNVYQSSISNGEALLAPGYEHKNRQKQQRSRVCDHDYSTTATAIKRETTFSRNVGLG